jgi:hypothetical protein
MTRVLSALLVGAVAGGLCAVVSATPATASCLADPPPSPYAFTGKVLHTRWDGRWASVRTDSGHVVVVKGGGRGAVSSVDRFFRAGRRYEFHPVNRRSPFRDNLCTATHQVGYGARSRGGSSAA